MTKIDNKNMVWIATANLIHPNTAPTCLVTGIEIKNEISRLFSDADNKTTTAFQIARHLVSWKDKDVDKGYKRQGGDRSRFLFQTMDGYRPSDRGKYRLYKKADGQYDGLEKTGTTHPSKNVIPNQFHFLVDWYTEIYFTG